MTPFGKWLRAEAARLNAQAGEDVYKVAPIGDIMSAAYAEMESATTEAEQEAVSQN